VRYWWVNQNQTYRQEIAGGYIWSPKRSSNGNRNPFYEWMREVSPGDLIFSFVDTKIHAIGIAASYCWESPKPLEFGSAGKNWENIGWKVSVNFWPLIHRVRPKDHMHLLGPLRSAKYSPLQSNGNGIQSVYLAEISSLFAEALIELIGSEAKFIIDSAHLASDSKAELMEAGDDLDIWEDRIAANIAAEEKVLETEREAIIRARNGQGLFKRRVMEIERACRITSVDKSEHLIASHCKPWRDCNHEERLNGENGLLLTPSIDHLFDRGFIGFEDDGRLLISPVAHKESLARMGIETKGVVNVGSFTTGQRKFLDFHRNGVLLHAAHRRTTSLPPSSGWHSH